MSKVKKLFWIYVKRINNFFKSFAFAKIAACFNVAECILLNIYKLCKLFLWQASLFSDLYESGKWSYECKNALYPDGSEYDEWKNCSATNLSTSCTAKVLIEGKMNY